MSENKANINWYPGHIAKTRRELKERIDLIDIVYEVIDSRMPITSKINDIDEIIKNKPRVLISTKYDLCDPKVTDKILEQYQSDGYAIFKCDLVNNNFNLNELLRITKELTEDIQAKRIEKGLKERKIRALVIGTPNVGKSTLINRLAGRKSAKVGNIAGITTSISWIRINDDVELLDSPGILSPKTNDQETMLKLGSLSSIKNKVENNSALSNYILEFMNEYYKDLLMNRYNLDEIDMDTIYDDIAYKRGMLLKGGIPNYDRVEETIITDFKNGNFGRITIDRI